MPSNLTQVVSALTSTTVAAGGSFSFASHAANIGNTSTGAGSTSRIYLSVDQVIDPLDTSLAIQTVPTLGAFQENVQNFTVTLPANLAPGTYYIGGLADYYNQIGETNEGDNNGNILTITVTPPPLPNLTQYVTALSSMTAAAGGTISFASTAVNIGNAAAGASTSRVYLSTDPTITTDDTVLAIQSVGALAAGVGTTQNYTVTLPANLAFGTYYIGGLADYFNQVGESDEGDNNANRITLTILPPNLTETVTALTSTTVAAGGSFSFAATASNSGSGRAQASTSGIYLSTDPTITTSDTLLTTQSVSALASTGASAQNFVVNLPSNLAAGTYYIGGLADMYGQVAESNEGDNNNNFIAITVPSATSAPASQFSINFNYSGDPQFQQYFTNAAARWSQVVLNDLPDVQSGTYGFIDDLLINVNIAPIDGAGGILGQAGWDARRSGTNGLPYHGTMTFDSADVAGMVANGTFASVVLHEIGHILGLGTLWDTFGLRSGSSYIGTNAVNAYRQLAGNNSLTSVPLETGGGAGTALAHWSEATFDTELMTGYAEPAGVAMPLSILTIGSLQDLGYTVNYGAADPYSLPGHLESSIASETVTSSGAETAGLSGLQLANGIASTFADTGTLSMDPSVSSPGMGEASPPLVPTPEQLKHV